MWKILAVCGLLCLGTYAIAQESRLGQPEADPDSAIGPEGDFLNFIVSKAIRGDVLLLDSGTQLKLIGVQTPKLATPQSTAEYFSKESLAYTNGLVKGKEIKVTFDRRKTNRSGQWLGYVWLPGDELLNLKLVGEGYGLFDGTTRPTNKEIREAIREAQESARDSDLGLWKNPEKAGDFLDSLSLSRNPQGLPRVEGVPPGDPSQLPRRPPHGFGSGHRPSSPPPHAHRQQAPSPRRSSKRQGPPAYQGYSNPQERSPYPDYSTSQGRPYGQDYSIRRRSPRRHRGLSNGGLPVQPLVGPYSWTTSRRPGSAANMGTYPSFSQPSTPGRGHRIGPGSSGTSRRERGRGRSGRLQPDSDTTEKPSGSALGEREK